MEKIVEETYVINIDEIKDVFGIKGKFLGFEIVEYAGRKAADTILVKMRLDEPIQISEEGRKEIEDNGFSVHTVEMEGDADEGQFCYSKVVGTTFREEEDGPLPWDEFEVGQRLELIREPDNKFDKNAVKVHWYHPSKKMEKFLGYIPKDTAVTIANIMDDGQLKLWAEISDLTGGTEDKEQHGMNIAINYVKVKP